MNPNSERAAEVAFLPIVCTASFYVLPLNWQSNISIQFIPQISAYLALGLWVYYNVECVAKLGLQAYKIPGGIKWGTLTGIILGSFNAFLILYIVPALGGNILLLRDTPHAQIPYWVMMPWFILCIACAVELNFRGFLLGRLVSYWTTTLQARHLSPKRPQKFWVLYPLLLSALTFSFDPFMVATFGSLHWIAVWDGLIWGWMWIRMTNLYAVMTAHAIEVIILYLAVRTALL